MSEEREGEREGKGSYLQTVIDCITERKGSRVQLVDEGLSQLYGKAEGMIKELDKDISICKKYNEAKINRKYEIVINDLQAEISRLRHNLTLEKQSRSPSKKHVSDLLEKMVAFKLENETLVRENQQLKTKARLLEEELAQRSSALSELQLQHTKSTNDRLPPLHTPLPEAVREFLREKEHGRRAVKSQLSGLEKMLIQLKPKLFTLNITQLLEEIDRWSQSSGQEKSHQQAKTDRIRSGITRKFLDLVDQPHSLLKPLPRQEEGLWERLSAKHRQQRRFSHLESKRSLNASFH